MSRVSLNPDQVYPHLPSLSITPQSRMAGSVRFLLEKIKSKTKQKRAKNSSVLDSVWQQRSFTISLAIFLQSINFQEMRKNNKHFKRNKMALKKMIKGQSRVFKNIFERGYLFYLGFLFQKMISVLCYFSKRVVKIIGINTGAEILKPWPEIRENRTLLDSLLPGELSFKTGWRY